MPTPRYQRPSSEDLWTIYISPARQASSSSLMENLSGFFLSNPWWTKAVIMSTEVYEEERHTFLIVELELFVLDTGTSHRTCLRIERWSGSSVVSSIFSPRPTAAQDGVRYIPLSLLSNPMLISRPLNRLKSAMSKKRLLDKRRQLIVRRFLLDLIRT